MRPTKVWVHATVIFFLGFGLRIWNMALESPGYEEMAATLVASRPLASYWHGTPSNIDFAPPLYYILLRPYTWLGLGLQPHGLRLLSVLAGTTAGLLLLLAGRRLFGGRAATLGGYFLALHPLFVYYSQEIQPAAVSVLVALIAFNYLLRSAETNRPRHWILFDLSTVALLHLAREAVYVLATFLLVHLARALFFPLTNEQRRLHRPRVFQAILYNYAAIVLVGLPWLIIMPRGVPWDVYKPELGDLLRVPGQYWLSGLAPWQPQSPGIWIPFLYLLLLPPALKSMRQFEFRGFALIVCLFGAVVLPFANSLADKPRFDPAREAVIALPFFALTLGALIARCNLYIRAFLIPLFAGAFLISTILQTRTLQKPPFREMLHELARATRLDPTPSPTTAFWPDYAVTLGQYSNRVYETNYRVETAENVLTQWAEIPEDHPLYFVIAQFPEDNPILYTFRGALRQFASTAVLWESPDSYNAVLAATDLKRPLLKAWFQDPRSLEIVDVPSSSTFFLFTPENPVFDSPQFHQNRLDASYDRAGRRVVWTAAPRVDLELPVTLQPGNYVLRLHASPDFDAPAALSQPSPPPAERTVDLTLRAFVPRRLQLGKEDTISLHFSTEVELRKVPVHLEVSPMVELEGPEPAAFGLKIYSIAIDEAPLPGVAAE